MAEQPAAAVLGLRQTGAMLATGLRRTGLFTSVAGWDPDVDVVRGARKEGIADRVAGNAPQAVRDVTIVFIALRGDVFAETLAGIAPHVRPGAIVCSAGAAHEIAAEHASRLLPQNVSFVAVDPIWWVTPSPEPGAPRAAETASASSPGAGRTRTGGGAPAAAGDPPSARNGAWCLSPSPAARGDAIAFVAHAGERLGLEPFFLDAREHDALVTATELLPPLIIATLMRVVTRQSSWREMSRLAGATLHDATALFAHEPAELQAALAEHRVHLVRWIDALTAELDALRATLADGREPADFVESAAVARAKWLAEREVPPDVVDLPPSADLPRRRFLF